MTDTEYTKDTIYFLVRNVNLLSGKMDLVIMFTSCDKSVSAMYTYTLEACWNSQQLNR